MKLSKFSFLIFTLLLILPLILKAELKVANLKCEYKTNPLGITETNPRLSWIITSTERDQYQSAYRILVSTSQDLLNQDVGDLWDTQKILSNENSSIEYNGTPLISGEMCFWKVKIWNQGNIQSDWSQISFWSIGLLKSQGWKASWIGYDNIPYIYDEFMVSDFLGIKWIWYALDATLPDKCTRYFKKQFYIDNIENIDSAKVLITADDNFKIYLNDSIVGQTPTAKDWTNIYFFDCKPYIKKNKNEIIIEAENLKLGWAGVFAKFYYRTKNDTISINTDSTWLSSVQRETDDSLWLPVKVLGDYGIQPWGKFYNFNLVFRMPLAIYLRKNFHLKYRIQNAVIYTTAKGIYNLMINGKQVNNDYLSPGWTDFTKRIYYQTYDVTNLLNQGENAISAILADGWYSGFVGPFNVREWYGSKRKFISQLYITYDNGLKDTLCSDSTWKVSDGPVRTADILMGETYDAGLEQPNWNLPVFNDKNWKNADSEKRDSLEIISQINEPVKIIKTYNPISIQEIKPQVFIFNLDQNIAGVAQIKIRNPNKGQKITIRYGERLNSDSTLFTSNLGGARATDIYYCKGDSSEIWHPLFTYHGFQYIEVTGLIQKPDYSTVTGLAFSNDNNNSSTFECSSPMINKLYKNIYQTQLMNNLDVPSDCPNRNERFGWTGDAQVFLRSACMNRDIHTFISKWLVDLNNQQLDNGEYPAFSPALLKAWYGGPGWADAGIICAWTMYDVYGDIKILQSYYKNFKKFIDYRLNQCNADLIPNPGFYCYGDWNDFYVNTPNEIIFMSYFGNSVDLLSKIAGIIGKPNDSLKYALLFQNICNAFNKNYISNAGEISGNSQAAYSLPISMNMLNDKQKESAGQHLADLIISNNYKLTTGYLGTKALMLALDKINRNDLAFHLLFQEELPSWGFMIKKGATSLWENWDCITTDNSFHVYDGMPYHSLAHYAFGSVYQWMVENIGGIRNTSPGYKTIEIKPAFNENIGWAKVGYTSIMGDIKTDYKWDNNSFNLNVTIPPNVKAIVHIPSNSPDNISESGVLAKYSKGVRLIDSSVNESIFEIGSGSYSFVTLPITIYKKSIDSTSVLASFTVYNLFKLNETKTITSYSLYSLNGIELLKCSLNEKSLIIDMSNYCDGIYFIKLVRKDNSIKIYKIIKVKS